MHSIMMGQSSQPTEKKGIPTNSTIIAKDKLFVQKYVITKSV